MTEVRSFLHNDAEFEHAIAEATRLLDCSPLAQTGDDCDLDELLRQIVDYHDNQPPAPSDPNLERLQALDRRLASFGKRWPKVGRADDSEHWEPLLGGDMSPAHHTR